MRYFVCEEGHGLFVRPSSVESVDAPPRSVWEEWEDVAGLGEPSCPLADAADAEAAAAGAAPPAAEVVAAEATAQQLPGDGDEVNEEVRWIAEQLRAPDNKMTIEEVLAKAKRRRAERSRGKEPMPSGFREDDSHVGYSGGPGEGRIVSPRLG